MLRSNLMLITFFFQTKFYESFSNVVAVKYPYPHKEDRSVLAFCKLREQIDEALDAGAARAGGTEIIGNIKVFLV